MDQLYLYPVKELMEWKEPDKAISISDTLITGHTVEFREAARSEKGLESIGLGAKLLALTALELILDPSRLEKIKNDHSKFIKEQNQ